MKFFTTGQGEMDQWRKKKEEEEDAGDGIWGRLSEDYLRVVAVLGRDTLNNTKTAAYHEIHPLRLPSGLERSDGDAGSNWERGVNPSLHCRRDHIRATAPSYYTSLIHCAVVCISLEVHRSVLPPTSPLPPPNPTELYLIEAFMGRLTGCSAHQEIKVTWSKCALACCDLFNCFRVNITDACKAGIMEELDELHCGSRSVSFLLGFTNTHTYKHTIRAHFSALSSDQPQVTGLLFHWK